MYFASPTRKRDVCVFEVIDGFGGDTIDPDDKLFQFGFASTPGLPLPEGASLQMSITNPTELRHAVKHAWKSIGGLRRVRRSDRATVIYADAVGKRLWNLLG